MKKISLILALLTALIIVGGLVGCSEYEAPPPPPPAIEPTFAAGAVTAVGGSVAIASNNKGYTLTRSAGYEAGYAYFKVTFSGAFRISDYSKVTCKITSSETGYKRSGVLAFNSAPAGSLAGSINDNSLTFDGTNVGPQLNFTAATTALDASFNIDSSKAVSLNAIGTELFIVIYVHTNTPETITVADIKFE